MAVALHVGCENSREFALHTQLVVHRQRLSCMRPAVVKLVGGLLFSLPSAQMRSGNQETPCAQVKSSARVLTAPLGPCLLLPCVRRSYGCKRTCTGSRPSSPRLRPRPINRLRVILPDVHG